MNRIARLEYLQELGAVAGSPEITLRPLKDLNFSNAVAYQDAFFDYVKDGRTRVKLELSGVAFIDSGGVGTLVKLRKALEGSGGGLVILNPGTTVQNILKLVGLSGLVKHETVRAGAASAAPSGLEGVPASARSPSRTPDAPALSGEADEEVDAKVDALLMEAHNDPRPGDPPPRATEARADVRAEVRTDVRVEVKENVTYLNAQALLDELLGHLTRGVNTVRLDVARVEFIDSAGVGMLLKAAKAFNGAGGELTLLSPTVGLQRILKIVKLDRVLRIES